MAISLTIMVHRMLMYATICKSVNNTDRTICSIYYCAGFTGQLRGWWDNYMPSDARTAVINARAANEVVDLPINMKPLDLLLNGLKCRHLGEFRWYKDTYLSRVTELPENGLDLRKAKFIDGLPSLFAKEQSLRWISFREKSQLEILYSIGYQMLQKAPTKKLLNLRNLIDLIIRKLRSVRRTREERNGRTIVKSS
ncbi:hypothetical protein H5410_007679 [Solanum commersonii]|uniref:DUF7746 domain-containing protein n=1 Tax=Solanum commersonii TaxID=4109 RepID=A0A9J6ACS4_SOLCO|nr:hypothetical protein H5410_007679 [Solanum commersonii]